MTTDAFPVLRLTGPSDWLQALPYLFGFTPRQSLVVLCLGGSNGKRLTFHLRVDLPGPADRGELVGHLADVLSRQSFEDLLAVICRDEPGPPDDDDRTLWALLSERVVIPGRAIDALVVRADRYWSLVCGNPRCCPIEGSPVPTVEDSARIPAELVLRGCQAHESRDDVVAELAPLPGPARALLGQRCLAADDAVFAEDAEPPGWSPAWVEAAVRRWADLLDDPALAARLDADVAAALVVPLTHLTLRDCVAGVCLSRRERARPVLRELVRRLPEEWVPAPATILGLLEWADGDGLRAGIAFDRALEADPTYRFATMLATGLGHGIKLPAEFLDSILALGDPNQIAGMTAWPRSRSSSRASSLKRRRRAR